MIDFYVVVFTEDLNIFNTVKDYNPPIPISQYIENFMALDSSGDLERFSGDGDSEIYNYEFVIDSENKQVSILGNYSL